MHTTKRAVLLSCSDHYNHRLYVIDGYLKSQGYETVYYTGDFDHSSKKVFHCSVPGCRQIHVRPYRKNLSLARILSHRDFARLVFQELEQDPPDVVVAQLPPNYLAHYGARFKRRHPDTKLIFEIFDMWPETFPSGSVKQLLALPFSIWAGLRDKNLPAADRVIPECRLFCRKLGLPEENAIYLAAQRSPDQPHQARLRADGLDLCYLGAINNVVNVDAIADLTAQLRRLKPVTVHIIGDGEKCPQLPQALKDAGAEVDWRGVVYDEAEKHAVMSCCHFGFNLMKPDVCVGLTMKSVDYFRHDLPILNNIPADTAELVDREQVGVNVGPDTAAQVAGMTVEDCLRMRENVRRVFDETFDLPVVQARYAALLRGIV